MDDAVPNPVPPGPDPESRAWVVNLGAEDSRAESARRRLHELLLRAAHFEVNRRRGSHPHLRGDDLDDLANQAADDAMIAILAKVDGYRGDSRFTTWAYKFALLEVAVKLRRQAWRAREIPLPPEHFPQLSEPYGSPVREAENRATLAAIATAIEVRLTAHQREVLTAAVLNEVPIDVLAERFETTRGAIYKTIHDARRKLREYLTEVGMSPTGEEVKR